MKTKNMNQKWFVLAVVLTAPLLYVIDIFIINMAIPGIKNGVHASNGDVQLMIAGYLLGSASFLITGGRAGDYFGRKKVFFWGMFYFTLTSCLCGLSQTPFQLNITRFFQGVSSAFMAPQSLAFIQILFSNEKERATAVGWYGITLSIAAIIGQILGGYLVDTHFWIAGWRLVFLINLPIGTISLLAIWKFLEETEKDNKAAFDYQGSIILTIALATTIYPLTQGRDLGWPLSSLVMLTLSIFVWVYFVLNQRQKLRRNKVPLIDLTLFQIKDFNIGMLAVLFHFMLHTSYLLISAVYLQSGLGYSALNCGLFFILHALLFMASSFFASLLIVRFGKWVLQVGLVLILISFLLQLRFFEPHVSWITINLLIGLYGLGNGLVLPSLLTIGLKSIPTKFSGVAAGVFSTFQQTASALGISLLAGIFYQVLAFDKAHPDYKKAFDYSLSGSIAFLFIVSLMLFLLPKITSKSY
ncbi:MFS transporter [Mucilaginibacter sp. R-33]|uniref:MFS transporter n=1 Tax=Mucilaginibacter sp. R-33 TaxID=3416711 RepID=UPI003CED9117